MTAKIVPINANSIGPIEDGVPMPPQAGGIGRPATYPFGDLRVKQSFTVPLMLRAAVASAATRYAANHPPKKFTTRVDGDRVRVWRIK